MEVIVGSVLVALSSVVVALIQVRKSLLGRIDILERTVRYHSEWWKDFNERGWRNLPDEVGDAVSLSLTLTRLTDAIDVMHKKMDHHIEWEEGQKYEA